jgi:hypothetical protein
MIATSARARSSAKAVRRPEALPETLWGAVHHVLPPPLQNDLDVKEIVNLSAGGSRWSEVNIGQALE